jgi:hypothetical protein
MHGNGSHTCQADAARTVVRLARAEPVAAHKCRLGICLPALWQLRIIGSCIAVAAVWMRITPLARRLAGRCFEPCCRTQDEPGPGTSAFTSLQRSVVLPQSAMGPLQSCVHNVDSGHCYPSAPAGCRVHQGEDGLASALYSRMRRRRPTATAAWHVQLRCIVMQI